VTVFSASHTHTSEECYQIGVFCRLGLGVVVAGAGVRFHGEVWFKRRGVLEWSGEQREACGGVSGDQRCVAVLLMCSESCEGL